jgi:hypothetical protein
MGRWSQYEEDSYLLPEGFTRIAYDADTGRYTFRDRAGHIYVAAPGEPMKRLDRHSSSTSRPLFDTDKPRVRRSSDPGPPPQTFQEILPSDLISSAPPPPRTGPSKFIRAVRRTGLPKMQVVVRNLRRSTKMRRLVNEDTERLLSRSSTFSN